MRTHRGIWNRGKKVEEGMGMHVPVWFLWMSVLAILYSVAGGGDHGGGTGGWVREEIEML